MKQPHDFLPPACARRRSAWRNRMAAGCAAFCMVHIAGSAGGLRADDHGLEGILGGLNRPDGQASTTPATPPGPATSPTPAAVPPNEPTALDRFRSQRAQVAEQLAALQDLSVDQLPAQPQAVVARELRRQRDLLARAREQVLLTAGEPRPEVVEAVRLWQSKWGELPDRFLRAERFASLPKAEWLRIGGHAGVADPAPIAGPEWAGLCSRALADLVQVEKTLAAGYGEAQRTTGMALTEWEAELQRAAVAEDPLLNSGKASPAQVLRLAQWHLHRGKILSGIMARAALDERIARLTAPETGAAQVSGFLMAMKRRAPWRHEKEVEGLIATPAGEGIPVRPSEAGRLRVEVDGSAGGADVAPQPVPELLRLVRRLYTVHYRKGNFDALAQAGMERELEAYRARILPPESRPVERRQAEQSAEFRRDLEKERERLTADLPAKRSDLNDEAGLLVSAIARVYDASPAAPPPR